MFLVYHLVMPILILTVRGLIYNLLLPCATETLQLKGVLTLMRVCLYSSHYISVISGIPCCQMLLLFVGAVSTGMIGHSAFLTPCASRILTDFSDKKVPSGVFVNSLKVSCFI